MRDTDFHWLVHRLPLCHCGAKPKELNNITDYPDLDTIQYLDHNDDGTFYVRWRCAGDGSHIISANIHMQGVNDQVPAPPTIKGIQYAQMAEFGQEAAE